MIKDKLQNAKIYYNLSENLNKGFEWLEKVDLINVEDGKYEIDGSNVYASVQTYETKENANYESHRKYIDIQYMIDGVEKVGVTDLSNCSTCIEYDSEKDLEFYNISCEEEYIDLASGQFVVLFPNDAHKPSISKKEKTTVKKVVVKVAV
jgi:YhcH/YjgK/YiaL family protein